MNLAIVVASLFFFSNCGYFTFFFFQNRKFESLTQLKKNEYIDILLKNDMHVSVNYRGDIYVCILAQKKKRI